ncbi:E3 ubiquitin-protein ligase pellino homolog 3 isoform X3 [Macaca mulatta]
MVLEGNPEVGSPRTSDLQHRGNKGSCVLSSPGEDAQPGEDPIKYGELIVLGYNGCLASGDKGRRRSRLALSRRPHANGVKPDVMHHISTPLVSKALSNRGQHSISYTLSRSHSVIVEYTHDSDTDMFQIGRSTENMIDFVVTDTSPGGGAAEGPSAQSTISRYACRILCDRRPPYTARIYAAGFDASSNIFLGVSEPQEGTNSSSVRQGVGLGGGQCLWHIACWGAPGGCDLIPHVVPGAGGQMADPRWPDGWTDHQWCSGDAPGGRLLRGLSPRCLAGDLGLWECVHIAGQPLSPAAGQAGGKRVQRAAGRLSHRPVWGHTAVAHTGGAAAGSNTEATGGPAAGGKCSAAPVPRGPQHSGLPQPSPWPHSTRQTAAMGLRPLRARPRLPRLGLPAGAGPPGARMSSLPSRGALCASMAWPGGRSLPGPWAA